jgi:hypothetical protein
MRGLRTLVIVVIIFFAVEAHACSKHDPCPVISFSPAMPRELSNLPVGTVISRVSVTLNPSNAGQFTGTLAFGTPYGNDAGLAALSGRDIVLAKPFPPGSSIQNLTVKATQ